MSYSNRLLGAKTAGDALQNDSRKSRAEEHLRGGERADRRDRPAGEPNRGGAGLPRVHCPPGLQLDAANRRLTGPPASTLPQL